MVDQPSLTVFVSYSHDSDAHAAWVRKLAGLLEELPEFHVVFDQYDLRPGMDLTHFMDLAVKSDRVVVVVTPEYVRKATERVGGVGYEVSIISADVLANQLADRVVPLLRAGTQRPSFLQSKVYVDFANESRLAAAIEELRAALLQLPRAIRPGKKAPLAASPRSDVTAPPRQPVPQADLLDDLNRVNGELRASTRALESFGDTVDAIRAAGRWSSMIGLAVPAELSRAEVDAHRALREHRQLLDDVMGVAGDVHRNSNLPDEVRTRLGEVLDHLAELRDQAARAEPLLASMRNGLTAHGLTQTAEYLALTDSQRRVRIALRQYAELVRHLRSDIFWREPRQS